MDVSQLRNNLKFVTKDNMNLNRNPFDSFEEAEELVKDLWAENDIPLEKSGLLQEHVEGKTAGKAQLQFY